MASGISKVVLIETKNKSLKEKLSECLQLMHDVVTGKQGNATKKQRRSLSKTQHIVNVITLKNSGEESRNQRLAVRLLEKVLSILNKKLIKVDSNVQHQPNLFVVLLYRLKPSQDGKSDSLKGNLITKAASLSYFQWSNTCNETKFT